MQHIFFDREDGLDHCRICGGAEGDLPSHCPDRRLTDKEQEQIAAGQIDYERGRFVRYVDLKGNLQQPSRRTVRRMIEDPCTDGPRYRIIDIDNCISDDEWRIPRIDFKAATIDERYRAYHQLAPFDNLKNGRLISLGDKERNVYSTARPEYYRPLTLEWLKRKGCNPFALLMRRSDDYNSAAGIKYDGLCNFLREHGLMFKDIRIAFDDHAEVLAMYESLGIRAQSVAVHQNTRWTEEEKT